MPYFRMIQHLLPRGLAWRLPVGSTIRKLFQGLSGAGADVREYADLEHCDLDPQTTRELPAWQDQFGLFPVGTEAEQRKALASAWRQQGGQSPRYLQRCVQEAGFPVFLHEWWKPGTGFRQACCGDSAASCGDSRAQCGPKRIQRFVRNPLLFTNKPLIGSIQCGDRAAACGDTRALCNRFLGNPDAIHYLVNKDGSSDSPPPIPNDVTKWPSFHYWGAETLDDDNPMSPSNFVNIPKARQDEFERLILKLRPTSQWIVALVNYV